MKYIHRILESEIVEIFSQGEPSGLILAGIVGSGKTTLANYVLKNLQGRYSTFSFTSDDVQFRKLLTDDSKALHQMIRSKTTGPALVFIDEIQKSAEIFDAIKYARDHGDISFIVSGSNPHYLNTTAKKLLQRRAHFLTLHPISLFELISDLRGRPIVTYDHLIKLMSGDGFDWIAKLPPLKIDETIEETIKNYISYGGLPGVWHKQTIKAKLRELQTIAERGFFPLSEETNAFADVVRIALAESNSREFTYDAIFRRTRTNKRYDVNRIIDQLISYGYLLKKTPHLFHPSKISYLFVLSWVDPGFVHYFTGIDPWKKDKGFLIESIVHTALARIAGLVPKKTEILYYKPYTIDINDKVKYRQGEIDFIFRTGETIVPIEVKATAEISNIDTSLMKTFIKERKIAYGVICYGGVPYVDSQIVYWPYWLL